MPKSRQLVCVIEHGPTCRPVFTCRTVIEEKEEEKEGCLVIDCYLVALLHCVTHLSPP